MDSRYIYGLFLTVGSGYFDLKQSLRHHKVCGFSRDEMTLQACDYFAQGLDQGSDLDGANGGRCQACQWKYQENAKMSTCKGGGG